MSADVTEAPQKQKQSPTGLRLPKRGVGIRIDMTPMVDVAFLLLVFFMVTTVFRRPLAMEVNLPEVGAKIEVPESNVLTIFVRGDDTMTYRMGPGTMAPLTWAQLLPTLEAAMKANKELIVLVKIDRAARYERMVDMMDTLEDAHMQRFSVVPLTEADLAPPAPAAPPAPGAPRCRPPP